METLDMALTYAIDIVMALGGGYIGTSLALYLADRWNELEVKPKLKESQKVNIPLTLKATDAVPLELEQQELAAVAMPLEPIIAPAPERQEIRTVVSDIAEPEVLHAPEIPDLSLAAPEAVELEITEPESERTEATETSEAIEETTLDKVATGPELSEASVDEDVV